MCVVSPAKLLSSVDEDERDHEVNGSGMEDSFHSRIGYGGSLDLNRYILFAKIMDIKK